MQIGIGIFILLLSVWQGYLTYRSFRVVQTEGNETTSPFTLLAFWFSLAFAILLFGLGLMLATNTFPSL